MSFDVFFQTCNISDETESVVDPFSGQTIEKPVGESVTDEERAALKEILASAGAPIPDEFGCYLPQLSDGSSAEVFFSELEEGEEFDGGMIALRGLSLELARFMYSLASAGNLAMLPAMEEAVPIVTSTDNAQRVASRWPEAVVVKTPEELHMLLTKGFDAWKQFRDRVVGDL